MESNPYQKNKSTQRLELYKQKLSQRKSTKLSSKNPEPQKNDRRRSGANSRRLPQSLANLVFA